MTRRAGWLLSACGAALTLIGTALATGVEAASFLDRAFGTPELGVSARARAMGGAGAALGDGGLGILSQPVSPLLSSDDPHARGFRVQLAAGLQRVSENRMVPLYDTFDSYVHETAIAVNDHSYGRLDLGATWTDPRLGGVVIGFSSVEAYDPRYDYFDERRTTATTDQIVSEAYIETDGTLRATGLAVARELGYGVSVGTGAHFYSGKITDRDALVSRQAGVTGRTEETERTLRGISMTLGAGWRINERLQAALSWESGPRVNDDWTAFVDDSTVAGSGLERTVYWPARVHLGGAYRPRNTLRTTFVADVIWTAWSAVTDPFDPGASLSDTWDVRFGLEHRYLRDLPGRIGFRYERSPHMREADRAWFTFGAGWQMERWMVDGAVEVGKRTSRQEPLWPREEQAGSVGAGLDRVDDTVARVTFGVEVKL
jgi:hypothetical protein